MFDRLEGAHDVVRSVTVLECLHVSHSELDRGHRIARARRGHRLCVRVDSDDPSGARGEMRAAVPCAACGIEDIEAMAELQREVVAFEVQRQDSRLGRIRVDPLGMAHASSMRLAARPRTIIPGR